MITIETVLLLLFLHFVSDFVLQSDTMANNKSKSNRWLVIHTLVYSLLFFWFFGPIFGLVTLVTHTVTDWFTSRATNALWQAEERHWFFVMIGLDQFIHYTTLLLTYNWLF